MGHIPFCARHDKRGSVLLAYFQNRSATNHSFFLELRFNLLTDFVDRIKGFRYLCSVISVCVELQLFDYQM